MWILWVSSQILQSLNNSREHTTCIRIPFSHNAILYWEFFFIMCAVHFLMLVANWTLVGHLCVEIKILHVYMKTLTNLLFSVTRKYKKNTHFKVLFFCFNVIPLNCCWNQEKISNDFWFLFQHFGIFLIRTLFSNSQ